MWWMRSSTLRPPWRSGILDLSQISASVFLPTPISRVPDALRVARHAPGSKLLAGATVAALAGTAVTVGPRSTAAGAATLLTLVRGLSPAGLQFVQRGWCSTLAELGENAADRAARFGDRFEAAPAEPSPPAGPRQRCAVTARQHRATTATEALEPPLAMSSWIVSDQVISAQRSTVHRASLIAAIIASSGRRSQEIASPGSGQDHVAHRLVICDRIRATAQVAVSASATVSQPARATRLLSPAARANLPPRSAPRCSKSALNAKCSMKPSAERSSPFLGGLRRCGSPCRRLAADTRSRWW